MAKIVNPQTENEKILRLEEMADAIDKSLANLDTVVNQQELLIEVIETSDKVEEFKQFIEETKVQLENLKGQKKELISRKLKVKALLDAAKDPEKVETVLLVFSAFGIFE